MNPPAPAKVEGLFLGVAVADAIVLPTEGMSPSKIKNLGWAGNLRHRFIFGRGMWSDDTEQTILLAQSLLKAEGNIDQFTRSFAWELRWWITGMLAATGLATARAIFKLWLGIAPTKSGVWSAGNGSVMRTAVIAAYFPGDPLKRKAFAEAQTRLTHSDPKAAIATIATTELTALAHAFTTNTQIRISAHWSPFLLIRNITFLITVLLHGFGRILPSTILRKK
jgi:ADP-ribosylglycohydrolase